MMFNLSNKKVTIVGAQKSGIALSHLISRLGGIPKITDQRPENVFDPTILSELKLRDVALDLGGHTPAFIEDSDLLVLSPGVKLDSPPVHWARKKGLLVLGEIEFAAQFCTKPIIAVTGSNGKTTVVHLIRDVIQAAGKKACLCGNVGYPFSDYVLSLDEIDCVVLEVSSFQMESLLDLASCPDSIKGFHPAIAVLLNFNENHLDRHKDLQEYFDAKKRIFMNQTDKDHAVLNYANERIRDLAQDLSSQIHFFNQPESQRVIFQNPNHCAVWEVARILNIDENICQQVFEEFPGVEHRLEKIRTIEGVEFINDSKSTTAEALRWALNNLSLPIHLICGGKDKNIDFSVLKPLVSQKVKKIYAIGEARDKVQKTFEDVVPVHLCEDLKHAVNFAKDNAHKNECVLLSPMCASFDMFDNFEHRGKVFKEIVNALN